MYRENNLVQCQEAWGLFQHLWSIQTLKGYSVLLIHDCIILGNWYIQSRSNFDHALNEGIKLDAFYNPLAYPLINRIYCLILTCSHMNFVTWIDLCTHHRNQDTEQFLQLKKVFMLLFYRHTICLAPVHGSKWSDLHLYSSVS